MRPSLTLATSEGAQAIFFKTERYNEKDEVNIFTKSLLTVGVRTLSSSCIIYVLSLDVSLGAI